MWLTEILLQFLYTIAIVFQFQFSVHH